MYCPNCGRTNSEDQRFCRSCGLSLEKIVQSIAEQLPAEEPDRRIRERQRAVDRLIRIVGGTTASIVAGAVVWGIIYEIIIVKGEMLAGSIFLAFVLGVILFALLAIYRDSLGKPANKGQSARRDILEVDKDTSKLLQETHVESMPSITENTTELLAAQRKNQKTDA